MYLVVVLFRNHCQAMILDLLGAFGGAGLG